MAAHEFKANQSAKSNNDFSIAAAESNYNNMNLRRVSKASENNGFTTAEKPNTQYYFLNEDSKYKNGISNTNWKDGSNNFKRQDSTKKLEIISDVTKQSENKQS